MNDELTPELINLFIAYDYAISKKIDCITKCDKEGVVYYDKLIEASSKAMFERHAMHVYFMYKGLQYDVKPERF